jgi:hypothetical protein
MRRPFRTRVCFPGEFPGLYLELVCDVPSGREIGNAVGADAGQNVGHTKREIPTGLNSGRRLTGCSACHEDVPVAIKPHSFDGDER